MRLLRRFIWDDPAPRVLSCTDLKPDAELAERNAERARQVRERMGSKWILHSANQAVKRRAA